jgi:hypothetical protein
MTTEPGNRKVIMGWGKCKVEFGDTGENDAFATTLTDVGIIKDQSTELSASDGDQLQMKATGGEVVAQEDLEGTLQLVTTVIEPTPALYEILGIADKEADNEQKVRTHIVPGDKSVKVTPHNKGARGIKAPLCRVKVTPALDEQNGNAIVLTFSIFKTTGVAPTEGGENQNYWYSRFKTTEALK